MYGFRGDSSSCLESAEIRHADSSDVKKCPGPVLFFPKRRQGFKHVRMKFPLPPFMRRALQFIRFANHGTSEIEWLTQVVFFGVICRWLVITIISKKLQFFTLTERVTNLSSDDGRGWENGRGYGGSVPWKNSLGSTDRWARSWSPAPHQFVYFAAFKGAPMLFVLFHMPCLTIRKMNVLNLSGCGLHLCRIDHTLCWVHRSTSILHYYVGEQTARNETSRN